MRQLKAGQLRPADLLITGELAARPRKSPDLRAEADAFRELSTLIVVDSDRAITRFLELAITLCRAGSAGLSMIEKMPDGGEQFRWTHLAGPFEVHIGGATPIDFSPYSLCLSQGRTILVREPARVFEYFSTGVRPIAEGLIVPLYDTGGTALGTLWVVHHDNTTQFDAEDARVMEQLAVQMVLAIKLRNQTENAGAAARHVETLKSENADLISADAFLSSVFAASMDCIMVIDLDAKLLFMNQVGMRVMEIDEFSSVRGLPLQDFWEGKGRQNLEAAIDAARSGQPGHFQGSARTYGGTAKWWDVQVSLMLDVNGAPEKLLVVSRDITETWQVRQALREAQNLNSLIMNSSRDCIVVLDLEGNTKFISPGGVEAMEITDLPSLIGLSWLRVWKDEDHDAAVAAVAEARNGGIGQFQGFCPTHAGRPKWWDVVISPLPGPDGTPQQLVSIGRDITDTIEIEERLTLSEAALRLATEAAEIGTWDLDLKTDVLTWSDRTKALFGFAPEDECSMDDFYKGLHPDDLDAITKAFVSALDPDRRTPYDVEYRTIGRNDGKVRWVSSKGRGIFVSNRCVRAVGTAIDFTERRQAEDRQRMLGYELKHRMKNTLAMVQAIANQTLRNADSVEQARDAFGARLVALGRAQDILTQSNWTKAKMAAVVEGAMAAHGLDASRFSFDGAEVSLAPKCSLAMSLALHELATNATKYGALSNDTGQVNVLWSIATGPAGPRFRFEWRETGGPTVQPPLRRGFGTRMIESSLAGYFRGEVKADYKLDGLIFTLDAPLDALSEE